MRRLSLLALVLGIGLFLVGLFAQSRARRGLELVVHPAGIGRPASYDDRAEGGTSRSRIDFDSARLRWAWSLDSGTVWPYAGFSWAFPHRKPIDVRAFDSLVVEWTSRSGTSVRLLCLLDVPGLTDSAQPLTRRYTSVETSPPRTWTRSSWPLANFRTPMWWYRENRRPPDSGAGRWDRLLELALEQGEASTTGQGDTLEIRSVRFVASHPPSGGGVFLMWVGAVLAGVAGVLFRWRTPPVDDSPATIPAWQPAPLDTPPARSEKVKLWLESNYQRSDLSLDLLARELGLGSEAVSQEIRNAFGRPFKTVLNGLRLEEARRLLQATDLGVAEVAFKVGYGSVPHFNRQFREQWGRTPTEEREALRAGTPKDDPGA